MKLKKRIIALNIGLLAVALFSFFYITAQGSTFSLYTFCMFEEVNPENLRVEISDENVLKYDGYRFDNNELVVDLSSVGSGKADVTVAFSLKDIDDEFTTDYEFNVNMFGTIVDRTDGRINFNGFRVIIDAILAQLIMTEIVMLWMFLDYRKKGNFSYPMIACGGLSIYFGILIGYIVHYMINEHLHSFSFFLSLVTSAGMMTLLFLAPFMLILTFLIAFSNIHLMRHEGFRPVNALGIVFVILWIIGAVMTIGIYYIPELMFTGWYVKILLPLIYIIGYLESMFVSTVLSSFLATRYRIPYDRDYIIILGCAIRSDGTPTPLLKARVDSAVEFEKKQFEKTGKHAFFVPSGGQGSDEVISEGECMENYLLSLGIPAEQIVREDKSVNTLENMKLSKAVIDKHAGNSDDCKIAFSTTNYHVFRGYVLAKKCGFKANGISAKTKNYFYPNAFLREFIGLLFDQKWKHIFFVSLIIIFMTYIMYLLR